MSQTARRIYVDRSRVNDTHRCKRLRYLGYHAGSAHRGLQPVRKSIHLVIGGAVHAGLEVLLREAQKWLNEYPHEDLDKLFIKARPAIEQRAVASALADLAAASAHGVELDTLEVAGTEAAIQMAAGVAIDFSGGADGGGGGMSPASIASMSDSPIMIDFSMAEHNQPSLPTGFMEQLEVSVKLEQQAVGEVVDWSKPIYGEAASGTGVAAVDGNNIDGSGGVGSRGVDQLSGQASVEANLQAATGIDDYLRQELAALVEAMVRAYSRRRLRPLLEQFEVLEVEREGQWKLADVEGAGEHRWQQQLGAGGIGGTISVCTLCGEPTNSLAAQGSCRGDRTEVWFMSRLDALLLERSTNSLYLQSYKTAGSWDRRKANEAEIDMQGLSEAVDVELRLAEAWEQVHAPLFQSLLEDFSLEACLQMSGNKKISELVETPVARWLLTLPNPPRILGVRYEYLLKGQRRQDDKDAQLPGRYVFDSPLIRAYSLDGITADDRRWGHSYSYWNLAGQNKKLDYRSWKKKPTWKFMPIATWIDRLDAGLVQPEAYDKDGRPIDVLADQFVAPIHVYRNEDDMRDMLEQLEAEEVQVARDVAAVHAVEHDEMRLRSELNKRFPQNRSACVWPGKCSMFQICYGSADMRRNPEINSELYQIRSVANHPVEFQEASHA